MTVKNRKKILLITPPYHSGVVECAGTWLNLGFVYIAESIRKAGFDVEIYDAMSYFHDYNEIGKRIEDFAPDVIAVPAITASINDAIKILQLAKSINPCILTILGNVHPTFMWQEILEQELNTVDFIIRGEGEITLPELLKCHFSSDNYSKVKGIAYHSNREIAATRSVDTSRCRNIKTRHEDVPTLQIIEQQLHKTRSVDTSRCCNHRIAYHSNGKVVATPVREYIENLDILSAAWDLIDWPLYSYRPKKDSTLAVVSSSRGCIQQCSFCSQQVFWNKQWRARSPENFVAELELLNSKYDVNVVMLSDELPTYDRTRWEQILELLIERNIEIDILMETSVNNIIRDYDILDKYKKAGVVHIYVGVESARQETLDKFNKNLRIEDSKRAIELINQYDIISETSFVLGMPDETKEIIDNTLELAIHYNPDMAFFLAIAPWPYAELYSYLEPYITTKNYSKYNLVEPVIKPLNMTIEEVKNELLKATRTFFMNKFKKFDSLSSYKKDFMLSVMKLLMEHSYLGKQIKGAMPDEIKEYIDSLNLLSPVP